MTAVEFHTGIAQPVDFACRLLRKAYRQGVQMLVTAPAPTLEALDRALWTFDEREFIPHVCQPGSNAVLADQTPIWLSTVSGLAGAPRALLNLGIDVLPDLTHVDRLIEIVANDDAAVHAGRARWRHYQTLGLAAVHHAPTASQLDA